MPPLPASSSNHGGNSAQVRAPVNLHINTKDSESPRKFYIKKGERVVKMAVHEHHSAQLRPNRPDSVEMINMGQSAAKNNFNTLSQVSSANEYETSRYQTTIKDKQSLIQSGEGRPGDRSFPASAHHQRGGGLSRR